MGSEPIEPVIGGEKTVHTRLQRTYKRRITSKSLKIPGTEAKRAEEGDADFIVTLNPRDFPQRKLKARVIAPGDPLA
jgi:hypothetical protein